MFRLVNTSIFKWTDPSQILTHLSPSTTYSTDHRAHRTDMPWIEAQPTPLITKPTEQTCPVLKHNLLSLPVLTRQIKKYTLYHGADMHLIRSIAADACPK